MALQLAGCAVGPDYEPPKVETPAKWMEAPQATQHSLHLDDWWKTFNDPVLNHLIGEALLSNLDLKVAQTRIRVARANYWSIIATGLPSVNARSSLIRRGNNINVANQSTGAGGGVSAGAASQTYDIFQNGFDASWELDLFGGVRRAVESADANLESEEESRRDTLVTLLGDVARTYI
jgi:multidrug efflux system outer membrane protein